MPEGSSCLKQEGGPTRSGQVQWSLSCAQEEQELRHYEVSSYMRYYWTKWSNRIRALKARVDPRILASQATNARKQAQILVVQVRESLYWCGWLWRGPLVV